MTITMPGLRSIVFSVALLAASAVQLAAPSAPGQPGESSQDVKHVSRGGDAQADRQADEPADAAPIGDVDPKVEQLLDELEASHRDLDNFTADINYTKVDAMLNRKEIRTGSLLVELEQPAAAENAKDEEEDQPAQRRFAIIFDKQIIGSRMVERRRQYVFDGRWLAETDYKNRQFIMREVVPPGETLDPLKLGEGPFPLPIGQRKDDVLARFQVSAIDPPTEGILASIEHVNGMRLVPHAHLPAAEEFKHVDLFYDRSTHLPIGIHVIEADGNEKFVRLSNLQRNPQLSEKQQQQLRITQPNPNEWSITVNRWDG